MSAFLTRLVARATAALAARTAASPSVTTAHDGAVHDRAAGDDVVRVTLHGVPVEVRNTRADIETPQVLARLEEALALIATHQPWRLAHLRRDVRAIRVERLACRGAFVPGDSTIITELTFLARRDITAAPVASSIVHEGVHARVHARGVYRAAGELPREERLCRRAELAFGEALPADLGAPVIARARASLALTDREVAPAVDWHEAQRRQDDIDRAAHRRAT